MSYNVRYDNPKDGDNNWHKRKNHLLNQVRFHEPDMMGVQEALHHMVEYMDRCVGRIVQQVDDLGLSDNTLVIFYSDNGTHQKITSQTSTGPVVGGKGRTTDAGTHVPLIVRWTGAVAPGLNDSLVEPVHLPKS